ncbi:GNAT family N-acetyltransferase [Undibacterium sp. CY7W]|uniref:GNAT family N-acetyltransferase n=1 Tax=Undibacterium rugosum TaxID=2762291 RepID=A0A923I1I6_9BURK|nr:GNAT family N-acetyltransferase [Undibacterium rugosum]MBC3934269.1 GNAT family N-acetyltransferase [Undibacterium rugosum]
MLKDFPYRIIHDVPDIVVYQHLRQSAGLSPKSTVAASLGLPASLFAVQIKDAEQTIAMGRVIGDGGCFFQVVDIAVLPAFQGQGLGKRIMQEITAWLEQHVPDSGYVSLIADGKAHQLYAQFGFAATAPASIGMARKITR